MSALLASVHALGLLSCFALLGTSRIGACIRWLSFQGILFGLVPLIVHQGGLGWRAALLAGGNIALKGIGFPLLLLRLRARAETNREVDPVRNLRTGLIGLAHLRAEAGASPGALRDARFIDLPDPGRPVPDHQP